MATVNIGKIKFNWKGAYAAGTAYVVDDVVESAGSSYVCILASTGNTPPNATYWELMADKGTDTSVATTQGDVIYHNGTSLARLGAGTSGQVLQTGGTGANPSWIDQAGGTIAQFQFNSTTTNYTNTTLGTFLRATNVKVDITPTSASNDVFVNMNITISADEMDSAFCHRLIRIVGGTETTLYTSSNHFHYFYDGQASGDDYKQAIITYVDSPNTTSQVTYVIEFRNPHRNAPIQINRQSGSGDTSYMYAYEINV